MKDSNMNARNADSGSMSGHRFDYRWKLSDLQETKKNGCKVFSCFSCGGGSSMGYKLAGYEVIGNCEIDEQINEIYKMNNHPKHNFSMDIRNFVAMDANEYPDEIKHLDILDGSPPCSTFSMAGSREKAWGKEKMFREGQKEQTLDDLFFWFIKLIGKLQPKIYVAENVKGLLAGNAKGYVNQIVNELDELGYTAQIFLLNSASMGVPQRRERVFIIGHRKDLKYDKLELRFEEKPILYKEFADENYISINENTATYFRWKNRKARDSSIGDTVARTEKGKISGFTTNYIKLNEVPRTLTAGSRPLRFDKPGYISDRDVKLIQSFPEDYDFNGNDAQYVCGMSVPPVMMANIASEIYKQWLKGEKND